MGRIHHAAVLTAGLAIVASSLGVGREACVRARNVASAVQQVRRCISDDARSAAPLWTTGDWSVAIPINMLPDPSNPATAHGEAAFSLRMENPLSKATEWRPEPLLVLESPTGGSPTEIELELSYSELIVASKGSTVHYAPHHIYPGTYLRVVLFNESGVQLATRIANTQAGEVKLSLALPGTYKVRYDLVWRSGVLPPGDSNIDAPPLGVDIDFLDKASCPADLTVDQQVDDSDFVGFSVAYDILDCADPAMSMGCPADLNLDGRVDDADFLLFSIAYDALLCE